MSSYSSGLAFGSGIAGIIPLVIALIIGWVIYKIVRSWKMKKFISVN